MLERLASWLLNKSILLWVNHYMDQFEAWKLEGRYGTVYIHITYVPEHPDMYEPHES